MADEAKPTVLQKPRSNAPASELGPATPAPADGPRYATRDEIARGGMGRVVEAADTLLGRIVAIKEVLSTDPELLRRFARETKITARLEHPSIVPLYDAGTTAEGVPYYVMRKVSGKPLEQLVAAADTVVDRLALLPHVLAAAQAVAHAHGRGILHRDLKPSNILAGDLGETVVIDWGLAKVVGEPDDEVLPAAVDAGESLRTRYGVVFGTPGFMAPEQVRGAEVDERADVYALGATLYFLLARAVPHHGGSGDDMMRAAAEGPPRPLRELVAGVPPDLLTIVDKALAFAAADRYRDAGAVAEELQRFLRGQLVASHRYNRRERTLRFVRRHRVAVIAVALATLALAVGGAFSVARIVAERDRADDNAQLATRRQHDAELAQAREAERADQLLLAQARTAVATDPTLAVALLKQLRSSPDRWHAQWHTARALAAQAHDRGVARALPGPADTIHLEMSPDGLHAIAVGMTGEVWFYDLEARTGRLVATLPGYTVGFAGDRMLHALHDASLVLVETASGARTEITLPEAASFVVGTASILVWNDAAARLHVLDVATRATAVIASDVQAMELSADQRYVVTTGPHAARIFDLQIYPPAVVATQPGAIVQVAWSTSSPRVAVVVGAQIAVVSATGEPTTWWPTNGDVLHLALHDRVPAIGTYHDPGMLWGGDDRKFHVATTDRVEMTVVPVGRRLAYLSGAQIDVFIGAQMSRVLTPMEVHRLAGSGLGSYLIGSARGRVLLWDLGALFPSYGSVEHAESFVLPGHPGDLLVRQRAVWAWLDRSGHTKTAFELGADEFTLDAVSDRDHLAIASKGHAYLVARGESGAHELGIAHAAIVAIDPHGRVVVATSDGALHRYDPASRKDETLVSRPSQIEAYETADRWAVVQYADGLAWRQDTTTGVATTVQLQVPAGPPRPFMLDVAPDGTVIIAADRTLYRWSIDGALRELVRLPVAIETLGRAGDSVVLGTGNRVLYTVDLGRATPVLQELAVGATLTGLSRRHQLVTYITLKGESHFADLQNGEHWPVLPAVPHRLMASVITEDGSELIGIDQGMLEIFKLELPLDERATAAWLDWLTNARLTGSASLDWE